MQMHQMHHFTQFRQYTATIMYKVWWEWTESVVCGHRPEKKCGSQTRRPMEQLPTKKLWTVTADQGVKCGLQFCGSDSSWRKNER